MEGLEALYSRGAAKGNGMDRIAGHCGCGAESVTEKTTATVRLTRSGLPADGMVLGKAPGRTAMRQGVRRLVAARANGTSCSRSGEVRDH